MVGSHHSEFKYDSRIRWIKYCLIREARARPRCGKTQQLRIYTLNAYSDTIHIFMTWGSNILSSFTNRGELCTNSLRGLAKSGRWPCFLPPRSLSVSLPPSLKYLGLVLQQGRHAGYFPRHGESQCDFPHPRSSSHLPISIHFSFSSITLPALIVSHQSNNKLI